jgi:hypothetical protein
MIRTYPLFLIDRSKPESHPFDFVSCMDKTCGFVAKVVHFKDDISFNAFITLNVESPNNECTAVTLKMYHGGIVLQIVDYLFNMEFTPEHCKRVQTLLKKSLKKYIHAEVAKTPHGELDINNQIKQQELSIKVGTL